ncbi:hypothetical protein Salat_1418100 [Sesamum alatum]|uniref:Uncharacterized protein n=1 Tax=Sesamum alatum TaxID=300844 RepID=A0AAE1YAE1_9LAMI|nr:hypothetical protein Salat_1418100 [Sesamum alatum]
MNARIARLFLALRGDPAPVVPARFSKVEESVPQDGDLPVGDLTISNPPTPAEAVGDVVRVVATLPKGVPPSNVNPGPSGSMEVEVAGAGEVEVTEGPSKKRRRKGKKHRSKSSSKSSKRSKSRSESRATKDAAEEAENTKHFKEMVVWWKQAREELRIPNSRIAEMEGHKLDPG